MSDSRIASSKSQHLGSAIGGRGWFDLPLGRLMLELETASIKRLLPQRYYPVVVQTHGPCSLSSPVVELYGAQYQVLSDFITPQSEYIVANAEQLPFGSNSIDLLLLPHVLEFSKFPHDVLREVSECVVPEGILAISCFNPRSLLGLAKYMHRFSGTIIEESHLYSTVRVKDWLNLLGFQVIAGEFVLFRPLFAQQVRLNRFKFMETAGTRWWPSMGSIYILIAKKKEFGVRFQPKSLKSKLRMRKGYLRPMTEKKSDTVATKT